MNRCFGHIKLSEKDFTRYYNDLIPDRNPSSSLPLEKLRTLGLLIPDDMEGYAYWQVFTLHDIMQMKAEYVFDFNDDELFRTLLKADFQSIDSSKLITGNIPFRGVQGLNKSRRFEPFFRAAAQYMVAKQEYELPFLNSSNAGWGEIIDIPNHKEKLDEFAVAAFQENGIAPDAFVEFIKYQCSRWEDISCAALAGEYKNNISCSVEIYRSVTGKKFEEINQEIGRGDREYFLLHERNVLDRIFPDWKKIAEYKSQATLNSICKKNLNLSDDEISRFRSAIEDKGLYHIYLAINEIIDFQNSFDQEGVSHLQKALRSLAICFEESAAKFSGRSDSLKQNLKACWSPHNEGCIFKKKGHYDTLTKSNGQFSTQLDNIRNASFGVCESGITEDEAKKLLIAVLIRNHVIHEDLVDNDNLPITKHAIALLEAIIITFIKSI